MRDPLFPSPAPLCFTGCVITVSGRMTFTSNKSMEIEVFVDADPFVDEPRERYRAVSAFFTYVSLSKEGEAPARPAAAGKSFSLWTGASRAISSPAPPGAEPSWPFCPRNPLPLNYSAEKYEHKGDFTGQAAGVYVCFCYCFGFVCFGFIFCFF